MKKTVNLLKIIIVIFVILIVALCAFFLLRNNKRNIQTEDTKKDITNIEILKLDSIADIESFVIERNIVLQKSDDKNLYSLGDVKIAERIVTLYFQTDDNENIKRVDGNFSVELDKKDITTLQDTWSEFCSTVAEFFDIELLSGDIAYNIYALEGYELNAYSEESFEKVLNGEANFGLSAIDVDGTYWNATASINKSGTLQFEFFHFYERGIYENGSENIVLFESSESEAE